MRVSIYLTILVIIALVTIGLRNHLHLRELQQDHEKLVGQARVAGWLVDQRAPDGVAKSIQNPRPDPMESADEAATALLAYARALPLPDDLPPAERQRRIVLETERIQKLNGKQLKLVIAELRGAIGIEDDVRFSLLNFTLRELSKSHPEDALQMALEAKFGDLALEIIEVWGAADSARARKWLDAHPELIAEGKKVEFERALIAGAVIGDPWLALKWFSESGSESGVASLIARRELTLGQRQAFLLAFRSWQTGSAGDAISVDERTTVLGVLVFGNDNSKKLSLTEVSELWNIAQFDSGEIRELSDFHIAPRIDLEECVEWYEWIGRNLPEEKATRWQYSLENDSVTSEMIGEWLASHAGQSRDTTAGGVDQAGENYPNVTYPVAKAVPGKSGFVFSPYNNQLVDVRGFPSGTLVKDPSIEAGGGNLFQVP